MLPQFWCTFFDAACEFIVGCRVVEDTKGLRIQFDFTSGVLSYSNLFRGIT
jgi:hypothetical protein